jgi:hypothetical protein
MACAHHFTTLVFQDRHLGAFQLVALGDPLKKNGKAQPQQRQEEHLAAPLRLWVASDQQLVKIGTEWTTMRWVARSCLMLSFKKSVCD